MFCPPMFCMNGHQQNWISDVDFLAIEQVFSVSPELGKFSERQGRNNYNPTTSPCVCCGDHGGALRVIVLHWLWISTLPRTGF
ncbi:hypothetical protein Rcae01_03595 [Novipirellula caenicola]|uniref:Uncharacterized protein n=1 Tax=Novipirellula caenicola TaxID=1536901 RepID=A0ABP9VV13_9BACT